MQSIKRIPVKPDPVKDIYQICTKHGLHIATAESCTGGLVGSMLTSLPGISSVYAGGFVTYTNEMKVQLLGVDPDAIAKHTEVSARVAEQMAEGARLRTGAQIAISLTGIAGPGGGTEQTPVGTVYIGISSPARTYAVRYCMPNTLPRHEVRLRAAMLALTLAAKQANFFANSASN